MAKNLIIVESPGKIKSISKYLGKDYKVEASVGHIRDLPKSQFGVDVENNFEPKYITIRGKGELIAKLKKDAKSANKVYLATDPDREGEAISWHLANILNINEKEKCRITFNEITKDAVKNALKSPREIDTDLVDAQQARRILDRIVGYKISPLLWRKVRKGLSAGRVQSVATRLICDREEEIEKFVPEEYWTIVAKLQKEKLRSTFDSRFFGIGTKKIELKSEEQVNGILDEIKNEELVVQKVKKGERKRSPMPPFITSTLQQEAGKKLGFTTKRTMIAAQKLYEGVEIKGHGSIGLVSYIRTDSTRISNEAQVQARNYIEGKFGSNYVPNKTRIYKNRNASQDAHEAIRPSNVNLEPDTIKSSLNADQYKLYKLIWERFVASQMSSAIYDTVNAEISAGKYTFKSSGSKVRFPGFTAVYNYDKDDDDKEEVDNIPDLVENEKLKLKKMDPKQHFTQPPLRYTEASLVKAMEEKGVGRPSTYAPTITTIISRGYTEKERKFLIPTDLGKVVNDIMIKYFDKIVDVEFTAEMEKQLDEVAEGKEEWVNIMKMFYPQFAEDLKVAEDEIGKIDIPDEETDIICEKCGRNMVIKNGRFGKFLACPGFPECRNTRPIVVEAGVNCPKCGGKVLVKKTRKRRNYFGCENNPECDFMIWDQPTKESCPKCGNFLAQKYSGKKSQIKCSNPNCDFTKTETEKSKDKKEL